MMGSLYDFDYIEEDTFELNMLTERFCKLANYKIISQNLSKNKNSVYLETVAKLDKKDNTFRTIIIRN